MSRYIGLNLITNNSKPKIFIFEAQNDIQMCLNSWLIDPLLVYFVASCLCITIMLY